MAERGSEQVRVLVVDDEKNIRRTLRMILSDQVPAIDDCGSAEEIGRASCRERV